jgi:hypothetical protein
MLRFDGKLVKRLFWFGILIACAILAYFLEQRGIWGGVQFLLGVGAVLAFYQVLGRGVAFNSLKVIGFSLPALVLFYFVLDLLFPGTVAHRVGQLAGDPFHVGVLLALLLFSPGRGAAGPAKHTLGFRSPPWHGERWLGSATGLDGQEKGR